MRNVRSIPVGAALAVGTILGVAGCLLAGGCSDPDIDGRAWACTAHEQCGAGWGCGPEGVCVPAEQLADGAGGAPDAAGADGNAARDIGPLRDTPESPSDVPGDAHVLPGPDTRDVAAAPEPDGERVDEVEHEPTDVTPDGAAPCPCPEGPCCAGCDFVAPGEPCGSEVERRCEPGCGGAVEERTRAVHCAGESAACDGEPGAWTGWRAVEPCAADAECADAAERCEETERCACGGTCADGNECTVDWCGPDGGCEHDLRECDDADICTTDTCDPETGCAHEPLACDDGDPCTEDSCAAGQGCQHVAGPDGTDCAVGAAAGRCRTGACCVPSCADRDCGDDGCGAVCGPCGADEVCDLGRCVALPRCEDGTCDPLAGESCRTCPADCETEGSEAERCDGVDNDCDGETDEDLTARPCERSVAGVGTFAGTETCAGVGGWVCAAPTPAPEDCDGVDDDCDGETDEDLDDVAAAGCRTVGACAVGVRGPCVAGAWTCDYAAVEGWEPVEARCDGVDDDCDGFTDEGLDDRTEAGCATAGVCAAGVPATCVGGAWRCEYDALGWHEAAETSCDGRDNDCDGVTDEDACAGAGEACATAQDCGGLPCRLDIDGVGRFCAVGESHCVVARQATAAAPIADGDVYCLSATAWRRCEAGVWSGAALCDDGDPCTTDVCATGPGCGVTPAPDGTDCDDGESCTQVDACLSGLCSGTTPDPCDDGVPCTVDACVAGGPGCAHTPSVAACDDGVGCTTDACDPATGCSHTPAAAACDDGVACTTDRCDPALDCQHETVDAACDDGVACTVDRCDGVAGCQHTPSAAACDDGVPCTVDTCDPVLGCRHTPDDGYCETVGCGFGVCDPQAGCTGDAPRCDCLSLGFRGHERVSTPDAPEFSGGPGASRTFEVWFRLDELRGDHWGAPILTKLDAETSGDWALTAIGADLVFRFFPQGSAVPVEVRAADVLAEGVWTHAAIVFDRAANAVTLYKDGAVAAVLGNLLDMADTAAPLRVGPTPALPFGIFVGAIDEVRVWTTARAAMDVAADFARPLAGLEPGLAAYWPGSDLLDWVAAGTVSLTAQAYALRLERGATAPLVSESSPVGGGSCLGAERPRILFSYRFLSGSYYGPSLAILNSGSTVVDLSNYSIVFYLGGSTHGTTYPLPSLSLDVWASADLCGNGQDGSFCEYNTDFTFGANDTIAIEREDGLVVDVFGRVGEYPEYGWGDSLSSSEYQLKRSCSVMIGDGDGSDPFDPIDEWEDAYEIFGSLRVRCGTCNGVVCPAAAPRGELSCGATSLCAYGMTFSPPVTAWVQPSAFPMGAPAGEGGTALLPVHEVQFRSGYYIDLSERSASSYANFLNEVGSNTCSYGGLSGECIDADAPDRNVDWNGFVATVRSVCSPAPGGPADQSCADHPVVHVTWMGAGAYCAHYGKRLCSEAEWERAAKGAAHRVYAWGDAPPDGSLANCSETTCSDGYAVTAPTGWFPAGVSPAGAYDMSGNVSEWVEDDWHNSYDGAPTDGSAWVSVPRGSTRVVRGGDAASGTDRLRVSDRRHATPAYTEALKGFRCCWSPPSQ